MNPIANKVRAIYPIEPMLAVMKFGGTSVGSAERIEAVADRVAKRIEAGDQVAVVVSAMGKTTDHLIELLHSIDPRPPEREHDVLVSTGEMISAAMLATALNKRGHKALSMTGSQIGIRTDKVHSKAKIVEIDSSRMRKELDNGAAITIAGFQGYNDHGDVTTLGRGGSDTTAVALAAALDADVCEIYTDVDGIYTTDPRIAPKAQKLEKIAYDEMLELATAGAGIMQPRAVEFGTKFGVKIHVRSSFNEGEGTMIEELDAGMESVVIRGIAHDLKQAKITVRGVPDRPGIAADVFGSLADGRINVDVIVQSANQGSQNDISFTLGSEDLPRALEIINSSLEEIGAQDVTSDEAIGKVSIVGIAMAQHSGVAATMFRTLSAEKINIHMISTSEIRISVILDKERVTDAVQALHTVFGLDNNNDKGKD